MSELAELYLVFVVLYLFECLAWVPRRTVGFYRWAGRWRARNAFRPNVGWALGVVVGRPWPPLSPPWLAEPLPFAVDPEGITFSDPQCRRVAWDELGPLVANGNRVLHGDAPLSRHACRQGAASLAEALEQVRTVAPEQRDVLLKRFLDARFAIDTPLARQEQYRKRVRALLATSNALWLALFGGLGAAVLAHSLLFLILAVTLTLLLWPINSVMLSMTLRCQDWLPNASWPERSKRLVAMLSPLSGVRAADMLARETWANVDPLTVAAALLPAEGLRAFARPLLVGVEPRKNDKLVWWRTEVRLRTERILATRDITAASLLAPPERNSERSQTFCPACLAQYESGHDAGTPCPNDGCQDIPLRALNDNGNRYSDRQTRGPA